MNRQATESRPVAHQQRRWTLRSHRFAAGEQAIRPRI